MPLYPCVPSYMLCTYNVCSFITCWDGSNLHILYLGVCNHHVSHVSCHETLDIVYQFVANEVMKTPTPKKLYNCDGNKQLIYGWLPPHVPYKCLRHHRNGSSLEMVMDKFTTLVSPNCHNFVSWSNVSCVMEWTLWIVEWLWKITLVSKLSMMVVNSMAN